MFSSHYLLRTITLHRAVTPHDTPDCSVMRERGTVKILRANFHPLHRRASNILSQTMNLSYLVSADITGLVKKKLEPFCCENVEKYILLLSQH